MKCPNCEELLVMTERQGVEIDYCPKCRGVWLDKGELDKIIEKSAAAESKQQFKNTMKKGTSGQMTMMTTMMTKAASLTGTEEMMQTKTQIGDVVDF